MRPISFEALFGSLISGSTASTPASSSEPKKGGGRRKEEGGKEEGGREEGEVPPFGANGRLRKPSNHKV